MHPCMLAHSLLLALPKRTAVVFHVKGLTDEFLATIQFSLQEPGQARSIQGSEAHGKQPSPHRTLPRGPVEWKFDSQLSSPPRISSYSYLIEPVRVIDGAEIHGAGRHRSRLCHASSSEGLDSPT